MGCCRKKKVIKFDSVMPVFIAVGLFLILGFLGERRKKEKVLIKNMGYKLTPVVSEIMSVLRKHNLEIKRMKGDHIIINRQEGFPALRRHLVLVN